MKEDINRFVGSSKGISFTRTAEQKRKARERREQFEAEIEAELKGSPNPTEDEREAARRRVIDRWYPEDAAIYKKLQALGRAAGEEL